MTIHSDWLEGPSREQVIATISCPTCREPAGHPCMGKRRVRIGLHRSRWLAAIANYP